MRLNQVLVRSRMRLRNSHVLVSVEKTARDTVQHRADPRSSTSHALLASAQLCLTLFSSADALYDPELRRGFTPIWKMQIRLSRD